MDSRNLFNRLLIGVSSSGTDVSQEEYDRVHIHRNHAFSILAAHYLSADKCRYILVRDPHSRSRYHESSLTMEKLEYLRSIREGNLSSGAFWISWSPFLRYFSQMIISRYRSDSYDARATGRFTRSSSASLSNYQFTLER